MVDLLMFFADTYKVGAGGMGGSVVVVVADGCMQEVQEADMLFNCLAAAPSSNHACPLHLLPFSCPRLSSGLMTPPYTTPAPWLT